MGQTVTSCGSCRQEQISDATFTIKDPPDLAILPPEVAVQVLSHLDATDLCLASCVNESWSSLANVETLWKSLCHQRWGYVTAYCNRYMETHTYKHLYMSLDDATLTFASNPNEGLGLLIREGILDDNVQEITEFMNQTDCLSWQSLVVFLQERNDILKSLVTRLDFSNQLIPDALRYFFSRIPAPKHRGQLLEQMLSCFVKQYLKCNPHVSYTEDIVYIICYSLILLSVDLTSPHVKNKMSKREFIRNLRRATATAIDDITLGHMYDNIYIQGHVATLDTCA